MEDNSQMFRDESIAKLLLKFSIPIIFSLLISELYNMVDTLFVGRAIGGLGIGALVMVFPIQRIIIALSLMIAVGSSTFFSRSRGEGDYKRSLEILKTGFTTALILMLSITILISLLSKNILRLLGASQTILTYSNDYLSIVIMGSTFLSLTIFISNIMLAMGNNRIAILNNAIGALLNIVLDYILVIRMEMGVKGAALATLLSQVGGFIFALYHYAKMKRNNGLSWGFSLNRQIVFPIVMVGISAFIVEAEDGILMAVLNNLLANNVGDRGIMILGIISKIYMFLFITMLGIASAMQPIAAYNAGAKDYKRLRSVVRRTNFFAFISSSLIWILSLIFTPQLISLFVEERELICESVKAFRIIVSAFPFISIYYISIFYFQALGKAKTSILLAILRQMIIMLPLSIILVKVFKLGDMGVWLSYPIGDLISSLVSLILIRFEGRELNIKINQNTLA